MQVDLVMASMGSEFKLAAVEKAFHVYLFVCVIVHGCMLQACCCPSHQIGR